LPKFPIPVRTGFTTTNRYTLLVGLMTTVISPLLKPHITRFTGSRGSGTVWGRTTVSVTNAPVNPATDSPPGAKGERHNQRATNEECRLLPPGRNFKWRGFQALRRDSFVRRRPSHAARRVPGDNFASNGKSAPSSLLRYNSCESSSPSRRFLPAYSRFGSSSGWLYALAVVRGQTVGCRKILILSPGKVSTKSRVDAMGCFPHSSGPRTPHLVAAGVSRLYFPRRTILN
jgi:hypothetical protein